MNKQSKENISNFDRMSCINFIRNCFMGLLGLGLGMQVEMASAADINGKVVLDESWERVIYLSAINSFDDFHTASYDFLIREAVIDSAGNFEMSDLLIPENDRIYRLHICKKDDPIPTIIIGGKEENFLHFIMNNHSHIQLSPNPDDSAFGNSLVDGNKANSSLFLLFQLQKGLLVPPELPSRQNREFRKQRVVEGYKSMADTSSSVIIKLLALHLMEQSSGRPDLELMERTNGQLQISDSSDPYFETFEKKLAFLRFQSHGAPTSGTSWIPWLVLILVLIPTVVLLLKRRKPPQEQVDNTDKSLLQSLSVQEKKVFELLRKGASNKEISTELNIEVSTVKSHVYKIFSRLGVKSRKEIVNGDWGKE